MFFYFQLMSELTHMQPPHPSPTHSPSSAPTYYNLALLRVELGNFAFSAVNIEIFVRGPR